MGIEQAIADLTATMADLGTAIRDLTELVGRNARLAPEAPIAVTTPVAEPAPPQETTPVVEPAPPQETTPVAEPTPPQETLPFAAGDEPYENVKECVLNLIKAKGRDRAVALLARFGAKSAKDLAAGQYQLFLEAAFAEYDK